MTIGKAITQRIYEVCKEKNLSGYQLTYLAAIPPSTFKSILNGKSRNPSVATIKKIADGFGMTVRKFYDSDLFDHLDFDD